MSTLEIFEIAESPGRKFQVRKLQVKGKFNVKRNSMLKKFDVGESPSQKIPSQRKTYCWRNSKLSGRTLSVHKLLFQRFQFTAQDVDVVISDIQQKRSIYIYILWQTQLDSVYGPRCCRKCFYFYINRNTDMRSHIEGKAWINGIAEIISIWCEMDEMEYW